jgi:hypothetical protein
MAHVPVPLHDAPQVMPPGLLVTAPAPLPAMLTLTVPVGAGLVATPPQATKNESKSTANKPRIESFQVNG